MSTLTSSKMSESVLMDFTVCAKYLHFFHLQCIQLLFSSGFNYRNYNLAQFSYLYYEAGRHNDYCIIFQFQLSLLRNFSEFYFFICKRRRLTWLFWSLTLLRAVLLPPLAPLTNSRLCQPYSCLKPISLSPQLISYFPSSPPHIRPFSPVQVVFSSFCNYEFTCMISLMFCEELLITLYFLTGPIFIKKSIVKENQSEQQWLEGETGVLQVR